MNIEDMQRDHYDRIANTYAAHYGDRCSQEYRRRFIYEPMFRGHDLSQKSILEAMCGAGEMTDFLLQRQAQVTGLDISSKEIDHFKRRWPRCRARCVSILAPGLPKGTFDGVAVMGGLHHLHPHVDEAVTAIRDLLKPGGYFWFAEPHTGSLPDRVRRLWYKHDTCFASNEAAIDLETMKRNFATDFEYQKEIYTGNIGYLLIYNSMVFRIPLFLKRWYTPSLLILERLIERCQGKRLSCFVIAQWQKTCTAAPTRK